MDADSDTDDDNTNIDSLRIPKNEKDQVQWVIQSFQEIVNNIDENNMLSEECFDKFKKTSTVLSSILPEVSDSTLFEVDDILYPNEDIHWKVMSSTFSKEAVEYLVKKCKKERLASWLCRMSTYILERLEQWKPYLEEKEFLNNMQQTNFSTFFFKGYPFIDFSFLIDHFYQYFTFAQNEEEKMQRAFDILQSQIPNFYFLVRSKNSSEYLFYLYYFKCRHFFDENDCCDVMKLIDRRHCNDIEPYISNDANCPSTNNQQICDTNKDSTICEDEIDYTVEKYLFYDDFLKILYVLSMIYKACVRWKEIYLKNEGNTDELGGEFYVKRIDQDDNFLRKRFIDSTHRNNLPLPWWFETMIKKCPFLFVSKYHENMINDLIRMCKGEEIDDVTREELYFVICNTPEKAAKLQRELKNLFQ